MPDLRIKANIENGDLPKQLELFDDEDFDDVETMEHEDELNYTSWLYGNDGDFDDPFESVEEELFKQFRDQRNK